MADELELHFIANEPPDAALQRWRTQPPAPLREFEIVDESYNSLTYEARFYDTVWKIHMVLTLGITWLMRKIVPLQSIWKVTVRFDAEGQGQTKITILGKADEATRAALGEVAAEHGGTVDLRVGA